MKIRCDRCRTDLGEVPSSGTTMLGHDCVGGRHVRHTIDNGRVSTTVHREVPAATGVFQWDQNGVKRKVGEVRSIKWQQDDNGNEYAIGMAGSDYRRKDGETRRQHQIRIALAEMELRGKVVIGDDEACQRNRMHKWGGLTKDDFRYCKICGKAWDRTVPF